MIEVGEYVRTTDGYIGELIEINKKNWNYLTVDCKHQVRTNDIYPRSYLYLKNEDIKKHSKNIIDLIEVGDYVNGWRVLAKTKIKNNEMQVCILTAFEDEHWITINNETLKSIVTKEQFASMEYRVKEE